MSCNDITTNHNDQYRRITKILSVYYIILYLFCLYTCFHNLGRSLFCLLNVVSSKVKVDFAYVFNKLNLFVNQNVVSVLYWLDGIDWNIVNVDVTLCCHIKGIDCLHGIFGHEFAF